MTTDATSGGDTILPHHPRPIEDLRETGLLWLINRTVFHPRGFALALTFEKEGGALLGWELLGDGTECWRMTAEMDDCHFAEVAEFFRTAGAAS